MGAFGYGMGRNLPDRSGRASVGGAGYRSRQKGIRDEAMKRSQALYNPEGQFESGYQKRRDLLAEQYAQTRRAMGASKDAMGQELQRSLERQAAISGGPGGGAQAKTLRKGLTGLGREFGSLEAGLGAEEARSMSGLEEAKANERLAREEAIRAGQQFEQTMEFQTGSFADQMKYTYAELDENKKTNLVNAAALLDDVSVNLPKIGPQLEYFYGTDRAPQSGSWAIQNWMA